MDNIFGLFKNQSKPVAAKIVLIRSVFDLQYKFETAGYGSKTFSTETDALDFLRDHVAPGTMVTFADPGQRKLIDCVRGSDQATLYEKGNSTVSTINF